MWIELLTEVARYEEEASLDSGFADASALLIEGKHRFLPSCQFVFSHGVKVAGGRNGGIDPLWETVSSERMTVDIADVTEVRYNRIRPWNSLAGQLSESS